MATTYITKEIRSKIIDSLIEAMIELDYLDNSEDAIDGHRAKLERLSNPELKQECNDWCPDEWKIIVSQQ